jgi:hypothetical protein
LEADYDWLLTQPGLCGSLRTSAENSYGHPSKAGKVYAPQSSSANLFIFDECIRQAKKGGTIVGSLLDVAKAFDTVPHAAILRALSSQGVDMHYVALIRDMYSGIYTQIN